MNEQIETVIIGGGHAGLTMSYYLSQLGREHVVLEAGRVAERWRSERWDSFYFQFPNWTIELPGCKYQCDNLDGFVPGSEIVRFVQNYAEIINAPVRCGTKVISLSSSDGTYALRTPAATIEAANVVIATGQYQKPAIPQISADAPRDVFQIHSSSYRNPDQLPPGGVLVVGAGSSGCQIAEDLNQAGRQVYLTVGRHFRVPRRYRGRDYGYWRLVMGGWDRTVDSLPSPQAKNAPLPILTGFKGGHDVDFSRMAADGIVLLGHLQGINKAKLTIASDLKENLEKGDKWFNEFTKAVDEYVAKTALDAPQESESTASALEIKEVRQPILDLDLKPAGITSIIWATGFRYDFDWIKLPLFDETGEPVHRRGVTACRGIYFLGLKWLYKLKSAFLSIAGPAEDAAYIAERIK
jgi:putative flavoprotein involved in K+ transport